MPFTPKSHPGTLHHFAPRLFAFEHLPASQQQPLPTTEPQQPHAQQPHHTILFLGGLGDDLLFPSYPSKLAHHLLGNDIAAGPSSSSCSSSSSSSPSPSWSLVELHLGSAGPGWATSSLARDANDLASAIAYFRALPGRAAPAAKIVVAGHSTGCNVCMEYLTQPVSSTDGGPAAAAAAVAAAAGRPRVDGVVLQAGISDREALSIGFAGGTAGLRASVEYAQRWVVEGRGEDVLPSAVTGLGPMTSSPCARRWVSLASFGGDDDYFSSDLGAERFARTFGRIGVPVLCLLGAEDEYMPEWVDREKLIGEWREAVVGGGGVWDEGSGVVPGAGHNLNKSDAGAVKDLCQRIVNFVHKVEKGGKKDEKL